MYYETSGAFNFCHSIEDACRFTSLSRHKKNETVGLEAAGALFHDQGNRLFPCLTCSRRGDHTVYRDPCRNIPGDNELVGNGLGEWRGFITEFKGLGDKERTGFEGKVDWFGLPLPPIDPKRVG
jgi:hypothetical protein